VPAPIRAPVCLHRSDQVASLLEEDSEVARRASIAPLIGVSERRFRARAVAVLD
jgi:hypothetical protein